MEGEKKKAMIVDLLIVKAKLIILKLLKRMIPIILVVKI